MPVVMCSLRLWKRIGAKQKLPPITELKHEEDCKLGNWSATSVTLFRRPHVLFANEKTLLCALVTMAPGKTLCFALARLQFARSANRSLTGSLTELTFMARSFAEDRRHAGSERDYVRMHAEFNDVPHVKREPAFAVDAVRELFGLPRLEQRQLGWVSAPTTGRPG